MKTEIKQAAETDIPVIEEIMTDVVDFLERINQPQWERESVTWKGLSHYHSIEDFYIAYMDGIPAGCAAVADYDPEYWPGIEKGTSLFIHKLAVKRCAAGKGVSAALVNYAKSECIKRNIPALRLDTHALRPKLCSFYERLGFKFVGKRVLFGEYHAAFYIWENNKYKA